MHVLTVRDHPGRDPGIEEQGECDARPPMVHRRHGVVDVGRETDTSRDGLAALLEIGARMAGGDDDPGLAQALDGGQGPRQLRRQGDNTRPGRLDDFHVFRSWLNQAGHRVGAFEGRVEKRPLDVRAQHPGSLGFRGGADRGGKRRPDLDRRGDDRGQERGDTGGRQRFGDGSDRAGSGGRVLAGEPVDLEIDGSGRDHLAR